MKYFTPHTAVSLDVGFSVNLPFHPLYREHTQFNRPSEMNIATRILIVNPRKACPAKTSSQLWGRQRGRAVPTPVTLERGLSLLPVSSTAIPSWCQTSIYSLCLVFDHLSSPPAWVPCTWAIRLQTHYKSVSTLGSSEWHYGSIKMETLQSKKCSLPEPKMNLPHLEGPN